MERRVTLQKHRGDTAEYGDGTMPLQPSQVNAVVKTENEDGVLAVDIKPSDDTLKGIEGSPARRRSCKRNSQESDSGMKRRVSCGSGTLKTVSPVTKKKRTASSSSEKTRQCSASSPEMWLSDTDKKVKERLKLKTDSAYYTIIGESDSCWSTCDDEEKAEEPVQVPRWRERPLAPCYVMEGTENLGDDVFNKRHQRLEVDERRRKR